MGVQCEQEEAEHTALGCSGVECSRRENVTANPNSLGSACEGV